MIECARPADRCAAAVQEQLRGVRIAGWRMRPSCAGDFLTSRWGGPRSRSWVLRPILASVRRHRRVQDVPCDDGKELESSIDFGNGQRCSISGAVNQAYDCFTGGPMAMSDRVFWLIE